jgi:ribosomal protein S18 acetylase RimI-like enzyme
MEIVRLEEQDKLRALAIYQDCALWLRSKGIRQWGTFLSEEAGALIDKRFREGDVYVARVEGEDAGVMVLQNQDGFWGPAGQDQRALYLHGLGVKRSYAGRKLGREMLSWAQDLARVRGKRLLRLDTARENPMLTGYYEGLGFTGIGSAMYKGRELVLYEKEL